MKQTILVSVTKEGHISDFKKKEIGRALNEFRGKNVMVTIERKYNKRSNQQNRYLWGCCYPLIQQGFLDGGNKVGIETVHEFLKGRFLKQEIANINTGEVFTITKSTAELTTTQMMDYVSEIQQFAAEYLNVIIPDPNEQIEIF